MLCREQRFDRARGRLVDFESAFGLFAGMITGRDVNCLAHWLGPLLVPTKRSGVWWSRTPPWSSLIAVTCFPLLLFLYRCAATRSFSLRTLSPSKPLTK